MVQAEPSFFAKLMSDISAYVDALPLAGLVKLSGLVFIYVLPLILLVFGLRAFHKFSQSIERKAALKGMLEDEIPGHKILIGSIAGRQGRLVTQKFTSALETFLPEFNFGSPVYITSAPVNIEAIDFTLSQSDFYTLTETFKASAANLIVWGKRIAPDKTRLCFATPETLKTSGPGYFSMDLDTPPAEWDEDKNLAMAYVTGKRLRPSIGRPADFRAERLQPILFSMSKLLQTSGVLNGKALDELEDDYAAGALHVGEVLENADWLQKSIDYRIRALESINSNEDPVRWSQAKIDLGRAMCKMCELKFDPNQLQDAMTHIRDGIDMTKTDSRLQLAETGFAALQRAEKMLADRRRFSIRWSV